MSPTPEALDSARAASNWMAKKETSAFMRQWAEHAIAMKESGGGLGPVSIELPDKPKVRFIVEVGGGTE